MGLSGRPHVMGHCNYHQSDQSSRFIGKIGQQNLIHSQKWQRFLDGVWLTEFPNSQHCQRHPSWAKCLYFMFRHHQGLTWNIKIMHYILSKSGLPSSDIHSIITDLHSWEWAEFAVKNVVICQSCPSPHTRSVQPPVSADRSHPSFCILAVLLLLQEPCPQLYCFCVGVILSEWAYHKILIFAIHHWVCPWCVVIAVTGHSVLQSDTKMMTWDSGF